MSIADKLTYLNTTKQLLKTEINKINNVLDDDSTFRSYPQELFNGYLDILNNGTDTLWSNLEKVSASGEEATLENVETAPMKMVLNGNTSQDGEPTPDTPVEVKVVTGENVVSVQGKNLFNSNVNNYTISNTGEFVNGSDRLACDYEKISGNKITFSQTSGSGFFGVAFYDNNKNYISRFISGGVVSSITSDIPSGATYVRAFIQLPNNETANAQSIEKYKMMLEENSQATPYVPHSKTDYPINLPVENLINSSLFTISGSYNVTSINNGEVVGTSISGYAGVRIALGQNVSLKTNDVIYVRLKMKSDVAGDVFNTIQLFNSSNANITSTETKISIPTLTTDYQEYVMKFVLGTDDTLNKLFIQHKGSSSNVFTIKDIQVSYINGSYTPYGTTPIELCKINTYKDYFHKDSGKWYVHKAIKKVVLDGSENYSTNSSWNYTNTNNYITALNSKGTISELRTNYFKYVSNTFALDTNGIASRVWNTHIIFRINKTIAPTIEDFKTWLSTHNTIVYYVLATPKEEEITNTTLIEQLEAISRAKSVKDKTYISQTNDDLPFILDVEAIKEYEVN